MIQLGKTLLDHYAENLSQHSMIIADCKYNIGYCPAICYLTINLLR